VVKFLIVIGLAGAVGVLAGQQVAGYDDRVNMLNEMIEYRLVWLEDTTRVDDCSLRAIGLPDSAARGVKTHLRSMISNSPPGACASPGRRNDPRARRVSLTSVVFRDSTAVIRATVEKGERVLREDYTFVRRHSGRNEWGLREVRTWGRLRLRYPRRDR
jgi:hypothetical protein